MIDVHWNVNGHRVNNLIMRVTSTTINQPPARISNSNPICYHNAWLWKVAGNRVVWYQRVDWVFAHSGSLLHSWRVTLLFKASNISSSTRELQDDAAEISVDIKPTANSAQLNSLSRRLLQMVVGSVPPLHPPHLQAIRCTASVDPHLSAQHLHAVPSHLPGIRQWNQWVKNGSNGPKQPFLVANRFESFDPCLNLPKPKHWMDPTCAWRPQASSPVLRPESSAVASPSLVNQTPRPGNGRYTLSVELEVCTSKLEGFGKICRFLGQKRHFRFFISKDKWWKPCWRLHFWPAVRTNCLPTSPVTSSERRRSSVRVAVM